MNKKNFSRQLAHQLRKNPTLAEKILWTELRNRKFLDLRFLRQHCIFYKFNGQIRFFIADFYCHQFRLVVEVDGRIHERQADYDRARTEIMRSKNIRVIRFINREVMNDLNNVIMKLKNKVEE